MKHFESSAIHLEFRRDSTIVFAIPSNDFEVFFETQRILTFAHNYFETSAVLCSSMQFHALWLSQ